MCTSTKSSSRERAFVILKTSRLCRRYRGASTNPEDRGLIHLCWSVLEQDLEPQVAPDKQDTTVLANNILWVGEQVNLWRTLTVKVEIGFLIAVHLTQDWRWQASLIESSSCIIITITWSTSPESHWSVHIHFKMIKMWRERIWWTTHSRFWN